MTVKRLICISHQGGGAVREKCGALIGWDVCTVSSVQEANQVLEAQRFMVGLFLDFAESTAESDQFLRRHASMQWVGVMERRMLDFPQWRALITDHLCDFHTAPLDQVRLHYTLGHAHGWAMLRERPGGLHGSDQAAIDTIHGRSAAIVALRAQICKFAPVHAPVLIWGESGSGKELAAHAIHANSPRASGPFVPVNCGALPSSLIQSVLFGYERGSFTGAAREKIGLIEAAASGTLFLDEIGDLPKEVQSNLLRFLQEKTITRVGATRETAVDVRVIAASHVNLKSAVTQGLFREDLYYRLNVLPIEVPPLRERIVDLPFLAEHFFNLYSAEKGAHVKGFSSKAMRAMEQHDWPGNVRELINCVRRAMVLADGRLITPADLNLTKHEQEFNGDALVESRVRAERDAICISLANSGRNITHAARDLGVSRTTLYRLLAKHSITV